MRLCGPGVWGEPLDRPGAKRVLMRAVELGITLVDTADAYGPEVNERFIAETLYPYRKGLIIATKGGLRRPRARSGTSASPTSASMNCAGRNASRRSSRCKTATISPTARLRMCLLSVRKADLPSCLGIPWLLAAMLRGVVRLAASRAAEAQRRCKWQSLGC
jgi:hypothetical protein